MWASLTHLGSAHIMWVGPSRPAFSTRAEKSGSLT